MGTGPLGAGPVQQEAALLSPEDQSSLIDLTFHWDEAYTFAVVDGVWTASPLADPDSVVTAESAWDLRVKVRDDYARRQAADRAAGYLQERMST
jgi:hypothetical protein